MKEITLILLALALTPLHSGYAQLVYDRLIYEGAPTSDEIERFSLLPGPHSMTFTIKDPTAYQLQTIAGLKNSDRIIVQQSVYPNEDTVIAWTELAQKNAEIVIFNDGFPGHDEINRLNRINFSHILLVTSTFPTIDESKRLKDIHGDVSLTMATGMYPKANDKPAFQALPSAMPLLFVADYWPWYAHMDLMNMLPQPKSLRVLGIFPSQEALSYVLNINTLKSITLQTDFDPYDTSIWSKLGSLKVQWICDGRVPPESAIKVFEASAQFGKRTLLIDLDRPLGSDEKERLDRTKIDVEWMHSPERIN